VVAEVLGAGKMGFKMCWSGRRNKVFFLGGKGGVF